MLDKVVSINEILIRFKNKQRLCYPRFENNRHEAWQEMKLNNEAYF